MKTGSGMATLTFISILFCVVLLGEGAPEKTGECTETTCLHKILLYCFNISMAVATFYIYSLFRR